MKRLFKKIFVDTFHAAELESLEAREDAPKWNRRVALIGLYTAFALSVNYNFGSALTACETLRHLGLHHTAESFYKFIFNAPNPELRRLQWWASVIVLMDLIIPMLIIRFAFREKISDFGFRFKGAFRDYYLYIVMLVVMIPLVLLAAKNEGFQLRYPFYKPGNHEPLWPAFWIWEVFYFLQFVAIEFFFRGFMTLGLRKRFGYYSIFVMTIPYCMIHFGKPFPETISAIIAGVVLGTLSLKSRSIFLGILIHYSVAISMDLCALWQRGYF